MFRCKQLITRRVLLPAVAIAAALTAAAATAPPSTPEPTTAPLTGPAQQPVRQPDKDSSSGETPALPDAAGIVGFLNDTINWSQQQESESQLVSEVSDQVLLNQNRQNADQIVRLSFEFARAAVPAISPSASPTPDSTGRRSATYGRMQTRLDQDLKQTQAELGSAREKLATATGAPRTSDRVQIGGVTGQVLDIGLVRLHLLEYGGGADSPTGRVVAFSNSMVFQSSTGMYKYMPDIQLSWHELTLMLAGDTDLGLARSRLLHAAEAALKEFHPGLEKEAQRLEASVGLSKHHTLQATVRLRIQAGGLETTLYYPVDAEHSVEIDEKVAMAVRQALEREPPLTMAGVASTGLKLRTST